MYVNGGRGVEHCMRVWRVRQAMRMIASNVRANNSRSCPVEVPPGGIVGVCVFFLEGANIP